MPARLPRRSLTSQRNRAMHLKHLKHLEPHVDARRRLSRFQLFSPSPLFFLLSHPRHPRRPHSSSPPSWSSLSRTLSPSSSTRASSSTHRHCSLLDADSSIRAAPWPPRPHRRTPFTIASTPSRPRTLLLPPAPPRTVPTSHRRLAPAPTTTPILTSMQASSTLPRQPTLPPPRPLPTSSPTFQSSKASTPSRIFSRPTISSSSTRPSPLPMPHS